jgi:metal-responsive CopG/Arc/MetJ family transcriptional regulator
MNTNTVRLNITLPKNLALSLNEVTGSRERSRFIAEAIKQRIDQIQKEELDKILEEGYKATANENRIIIKAFEAVDLEGWDEY